MADGPRGSCALNAGIAPVLGQALATAFASAGDMFVVSSSTG